MQEGEHELPITAEREDDEEQGVGVAAQAFVIDQMNPMVPGWISGYVVLPPRAIKDAEGVGYCSQVSSHALHVLETCITPDPCGSLPELSRSSL